MLSLELPKNTSELCRITENKCENVALRCSEVAFIEIKVFEGEIRGVKGGRGMGRGRTADIRVVMK